MKKFYIVCFLLVFGLLCGCKIGANDDEAKKDDFVTEYSYYYNTENVPEDWDWFNLEEFTNSLNQRKILKLSFEEIKAKIESGEHVVIYYGFDPQLYQCPYCVACLPSAVEAAMELDIDIYYLDIRTMRVDNTEEYLWLYNGMLEVFPDFGSRISAPTYVTYNDSKPVDYHIATLKDSEDKSIKDLNEEQKVELKNIYLDLFQKNN